MNVDYKRKNLNKNTFFKSSLINNAFELSRMSLWSPTHVQFTVLRARNLIGKGKGGNNDVFVTIQLGKEKYQTSTIKSALNPEWFEECDLPIPDMQSEIQVSLYHRGVLSDDFLGYAGIGLWEHKVTESSTCWVPLQNKPTKSGDSKYRGELEVKLTFLCRSRNDVISQGLKKRSSSIRNLATAFGDKFKLSRSRSFRDIRENNRSFDSGKVDKSRTLDKRLKTASEDSQKMHSGNCVYPCSHIQSQSSVHFPALDINRASWEMDPKNPDALTRSYSMSAAYIKSMSLDRSNPQHYAGSSNSVSNMKSNSATNNNSCISFAHVEDGPVSQLHSQSLYNLPGNRRSCAEVPFHQPPPPPYDLKSSSKDDTALIFSKDRWSLSEHHNNSAFRAPIVSSHFELAQQNRSGIYESITERTEPENSISSTSDPESVPMPKPRVKRFSEMKMLSKDKYERDFGKDNGFSLPSGRTNSTDQQPFSGRDSGILDDRSPSLGNSLEASIDGTSNAFKSRGTADINLNHSKRDMSVNNGGLDNKLKICQTEKDSSINGSTKTKKKSAVLSQLYNKDNLSQGELVVRKRSRGQRDRLRQIRQANRRYTVQGVEHGASGLYDESVSDPSDSSRPEVSDDLMSVFKSMTKEELLQVVLTSKAQMIRKDQYIKDLENYIDDLLVRVMETTPRLLSRQPLHKLR